MHRFLRNAALNNIPIAKQNITRSKWCHLICERSLIVIRHVVLEKLSTLHNIDRIIVLNLLCEEHII